MELPMMLAAWLKASFLASKLASPCCGIAAWYTCSVSAGVAKDHIVKKANQLKNCTTPNFHITAGMDLKLWAISMMPLKKPLLSAFCLRKASRSAGGSSVVVKTDHKIDAMNTVAPMANDQMTESGTCPSGALSDTPK